MKHVTRLDQFLKGDFPMVCARSGLPATKMVPVQAYRRPSWLWYYIPGVHYLVAKWLGDSHYPWGLLPFAEGHVRGVSARYNKRVGVTLRGVHRDFVIATSQAKG